jgi:ATP-dependent Zn protease
LVLDHDFSEHSFRATRNHEVWYQLFLESNFSFAIFEMIYNPRDGLGFGAGTEFEPDPNNRITFKDVQGVEEAKSELEEIVQFLKGACRFKECNFHLLMILLMIGCVEPHKFIELGGKLPKGTALILIIKVQVIVLPV